MREESICQKSWRMDDGVGPLGIVNQGAIEAE